MIKTILYAHELSSSGSSRVVKWFRKHLPNIEFVAPDLPLDCAKAIAFLRGENERLNPDLVMGVSMGGFFAHQIDAPKRLLVNPAFYVSKVMQQNKGRWLWSWPRVDGEKCFEVTDEIIEGYEKLEKVQFEYVHSIRPIDTYAFFAKEDELVHSEDIYIRYYQNYQYMDGGHFLNEEQVSVVADWILLQ